MNKNNKTSKGSMYVPLNKHITQHKRVWKQGWKKLENANTLIRDGRIIHSKKVLSNPNSIVNKNLRYTIKGREDKLSIKKLHLLKMLSKKYIPSNVWQMFWSRWSGGVVSNMGKDFVIERGRRFSFFKYKFLIKKSIKTFYSLNNKNFKEMSRRGKDWPTTAGYKYVFFRNMERRLDVTLVRLGYALHLEHARILIKKGTISVDNRVITRADYLLSPASTVKVGYSKLLFILLYREHLKHYPQTWNKYRKWRSRGRVWRKGSWARRLSNSTRETGRKKRNNKRMLIEGEKFASKTLNANKIMLKLKNRKYFWGSSEFPGTLTRILRWKGGAWKRKVRKRTAKMPLTVVADQLTYTGVNQALFTHFYKHKDIKLPNSIQVLTF